VGDFWPSCGYRLLGKGADGRLVVTDDFLRTYLVRPELAPIRESGPGELALHDALVGDPRRGVTQGELDAVEDADARDNYGIFLRFRERLLDTPSLESAYLELFSGTGVDVPPAFVHHLTQVLLRHVLGEHATPMEARAAEMLFRPQRIAVLEDGAVMAADEATIDLFATTAGFGSLGELLAQNRTPARTVDLDVLDADNADLYWERDERHDFSVSLNRGRPALDALARVMERWVAHFLGARAGDRRCALGLARGSRCRGVVALERPLQPGRDRRSPHGPAPVPVPSRLRQSRRHAAGHRRAAGISCDGNEPGQRIEAQTPEPAAQPAARAAPVKKQP